MKLAVKGIYLILLGVFLPWSYLTDWYQASQNVYRKQIVALSYGLESSEGLVILVLGLLLLLALVGSEYLVRPEPLHLAAILLAAVTGSIALIRGVVLIGASSSGPHVGLLSVLAGSLMVMEGLGRGAREDG